MRRVSGKRLFWGLGVLVATGWACETARNPGGIQRDLIPPTIVLTTSADTQQIASGLSFSVSAGDNLGLKEVRLTFTGGYLAVTDTIFNTTVTSFGRGVTVTFPPTSGAGGLITIIGRATDGAGNFTEDTLVIFLVNVAALRDRKSTRLNSSHGSISYAVFCLKKKKSKSERQTDGTLRGDAIS